MTLGRLLEATEPYRAGEAQVVRGWFDSPRRTPEGDRLWIRRQAYKEVWDGCRPALRTLERAFAGAAAFDPDALLHVVDDLRDELVHFRDFAALHVAAGGEPLDPMRLGSWPENDALAHLRAEHRRVHGLLGERASRLTEGGFATLYREGRALAGRGGLDDRIAEVCARVYDDEIRHMEDGLRDLEDTEPLIPLVLAQLRLRIRMRSAQFGHPLPAARLEALCT